MKFEFSVHPTFNFLNSFAEAFDLKVSNNRAIIPTRLGQGYVKEIITDTNLKLVVHHYRLKEDFHLKRLGSSETKNLISIVFNSNEVPTGDVKDKERLIQFSNANESTIQVASSSVGTETYFPANSDVRFLVIGVQRTELSSLLQVEEPNKQVQTILNSNTTFFFHERMSPDIQRVFKKLFWNSDQDHLLNLFYRIKIQELIYLLFSKLLRRENATQHAINKEDITKLNNVHSALLEDISEPPDLNELAKSVGMSNTKMKQLFKQIYGDSMYNYYLKARMEDAAYLLKHANLSVSEVGHRVGYSNMSHFSRMFRKHYGTSPKNYTSVG